MGLQVTVIAGDRGRLFVLGYRYKNAPPIADEGFRDRPNGFGVMLSVPVGYIV